MYEQGQNPSKAKGEKWPRPDSLLRLRPRTRSTARVSPVTASFRRVESSRSHPGLHLCLPPSLPFLQPVCHLPSLPTYIQALGKLHSGPIPPQLLPGEGGECLQPKKLPRWSRSSLGPL